MTTQDMKTFCIISKLPRKVTIWDAPDADGAAIAFSEHEEGEIVQIYECVSVLEQWEQKQ